MFLDNEKFNKQSIQRCYLLHLLQEMFVSAQNIFCGGGGGVIIK